jgi:hypothetical protein
MNPRDPHLEVKESARGKITPRLHDFLCDFAATAIVPAIGTVLFNFLVLLAHGKKSTDVTIDIMDFSIGIIFAAYGWSIAVKNVVIGRRFSVYANIAILTLLFFNVFLSFMDWLTRFQTVLFVDAIALCALAAIIWYTQDKPAQGVQP